MKALIDADWFAYAHGGAKDDEGNPLSWPLVASRINQQIKNITDFSGADSYQLYLTGTGNFRENVATIRVYKGNRPSSKPHHFTRVRDYLTKFRGASIVEGMEADDAVSIEQYTSEWRQLEPGNTIICSIDKDLDNTPGWHYNWIKDERYWIDETTASQNFYCQLLIGDTVDNIPGLYGVGKSSKLLSDIRDYDSELDMYTKVREEYEKRFGSYWHQFLLENAQLLWILREDKWFGEDEPEWFGPHKEIEYRLSKLEELRNE